jgi:signal transduction histidine kinase
LTARSPRLRAGAITLILFAVAVVALGAGVLIIDRIGEDMIDARQEDVANSARDYFLAFAREEGLAPLARAIDRRERTHKEVAFHYALFSSQGTLMGGISLLQFNRLPQPGTTRMLLRSSKGLTPWQVVVQPMSVGAVLVVYEDLSERNAFRDALAIGGGVALLTAFAAVLAASFWLNQMIYRRAEAIEITAARIAGGDLSARAPHRFDGDVFDRLGGSINQMLDRIEELLTGLRTVTDSLSHDLRSPLTRMKSALARAIDPDVTAQARADAIALACDAADQALATTSALLDIARAESGLSRDMFQPVDLRALMLDLAELFEPVLEDAGQTLEVQPGEETLVVMGHELLIRQAVGNLLYNTTRYAGQGASVWISLENAPAGARIIVSDNGPGIPQADWGRVRERFVRLDPARTTPGSGLGLAIAAACAKLHGGALDLGDNHPGLRVEMTLGPPTARTSASPPADAAPIPAPTKASDEPLTQRA